MSDIPTLERLIKQHLPLINYIMWYEHAHTVEALTRFFRSHGQDAKSQLDKLVELGILEQSICNSYIISQDPLIGAIIEHCNERDRLIRNLCNNTLTF